MALTTLVHAFVGGPEVYAPVRISALDPLTRSVTSVVWHVVTAQLALLAVGLYWVSAHRNPALEAMIGAMQLSFVVLFIGYGLGDLGSLWMMPQWTIFLAGLGLMVLAGRGQSGADIPAR